MNQRPVVALMMSLCALSAQGDASRDAKSVRKVTADLSAESCPLVERCPGSDMERLWAQDEVDAGPMNRYIAERGLRAPGVATYVTVIDTGFDPAHQPSMSSPVTTARGVTEAASKGKIGDPDNDQGGHGTMVAGVIGGARGVGVSPNSTIAVYRVTEEGAGGFTSKAWLTATVRKACEDKRDPDGVTIINLSWGGRADEMGSARDEGNRELMDFLARRGCLVVKSAGNSSFRLDDDSVNGHRLDDPYLRVGATDPSSALSSFSSTGEVQAPGYLVYTLYSSRSPTTIDSSRVCGRAGSPPMSFVNGTSFSAPMTAGVAAEVLGVLKSQPKFARLSNPDRIALLNRILKASSIGAGASGINGLRAAVIAERWNADPSAPALASVERLVALLDGVACASPAVAAGCASDATCADRRACFERQRRTAALCPGERAAASLDLLKAALSQDSLETASRYFNLYLADPARSQAEAASAVDTITALYTARWNAGLAQLRRSDPAEYRRRVLSGEAIPAYELPFIAQKLNVNLALMFMPQYFALAELRKDAASRERARDLLAAILRSESLEGELRKDRDRGSEQVVEALVAMLDRGQAIFGAPVVLGLMKEMVTRYFHQMRITPATIPDGEFESVVPVRLVSEMIASGKFTAISAGLAALDDQIWAELDRYNEYYGLKADVFAIFYEVPGSRYHFDAIIARHEASLRAAVAEGAIERLASVKVAWVFRELERLMLDPRARTEFAFAVLERIAQGRGWGPRSDGEFIERSIALFGATADRARFAELVERSTSYAFATDLLDRASQDRKRPESSRKVAPLLVDNGWRRLAVRVAIALSRRDRPTEDKLLYADKDHLRDVLAVLYAMQNQRLTGGPTVIPRAWTRTSEMPPSRLGPPAAIASDVVESLPADDVVYARLIEWAVRAWSQGVYETSTDVSARPTRKFGRLMLEQLLGVVAYCQLPPQGAWKTALEAALAGAPADSDPLEQKIRARVADMLSGRIAPHGCVNARPLTSSSGQGDGGGVGGFFKSILRKVP